MHQMSLSRIQDIILQLFKYLIMKLIILLLLSINLLLSCEDNLYGIKPDIEDNNDSQLISTGFTRGVNLSGCFDVGHNSDAGDIWMGTINDDSFANLKSLGVDVVRVPMNIGRFAIDSDYTLDDRFWKKLDILLDLGDVYGITVIIDNHQWNLTSEYSADYAAGLMKSTWKQIAEHCKGRSSRVVYELKNEPDGDYWKDHWCDFQGELINVIREIDQKHQIMVCPAPGTHIEQMPEYSDMNIIYTEHFYGPMLFTHQGAMWNEYKVFGGKITFPYDKDKMNLRELSAIPDLSPRIKKEISNYQYQGTEAAVLESLDRIINEVRRRKAKLFIGEFGVCSFTGANHNDLCRWHEIVRKHLEFNGVSWALWAYADRAFSLFKVPTAPPKFHKDLNLELVKALGFTIPPSYDDSQIDESKFIKKILYDDAWPDYIISEPEKKKFVTAPFTEDSATGSNCIRFHIDPKFWGGKYLDLNFTFKKGYEDLEQFDINKSFIKFKLKALISNPSSFNLQLWAIDNKDAFDVVEEKHNWVSLYNITSSDVKLDGEWQNVSIPLKYFGFRGSEDPPYVSSEKYFSWSKIKQIRFTNCDNLSYLDCMLYFDEVMITGPKNEYWKPEPETPDPGGLEKNNLNGKIDDLTVLPEETF